MARDYQEKNIYYDIAQFGIFFRLHPWFRRDRIFKNAVDGEMGGKRHKPPITEHAQRTTAKTAPL